MTLLVLGAVILLLLLGQPLFAVLGALACLCFALLSPEVHTAVDMLDIVGKIGSLADKEVLLAIPFFTVAGMIMSKGHISSKLINVARAAVGWLPGGLAVAAVTACALFAAISGSSPATVIAVGTIMLPALVADGYDDQFSVGLVTTSGSLGILIPPSIPMIIYAIVKTSGEAIDVGELFLAGVGPGLLIASMLIVYSMVQGTRFAVKRQPFSLRKLVSACRDGFWALMLPVIILGGIYSGLFPETEASAVAVVAAYVIETFIHRALTFEELKSALIESAQLMGALLLIIVMAMAFNDYLADQKVPERAVEWLIARNLGPIAFLLVVNVVLLIAGGVMDIVSAIVILVPLLAPIAESLGIKPLHLAIIFIVNLELGYMTPPIGLNLFVASSVFKRPLGQVIKAVLPTLAIMGIGVALVTFVPTVQMGLVNLMRGKAFYEPFPGGGTGKGAGSGTGTGTGTGTGSGAVLAKPTKGTGMGTGTGTGTGSGAKKKGIPSIADLTNAAAGKLSGSGSGAGTGTGSGSGSGAAKKGMLSISDLTDAADKKLKAGSGSGSGKGSGSGAGSGTGTGTGASRPGKMPSIRDLTDQADKKLRGK